MKVLDINGASGAADSAGRRVRAPLTFLKSQVQIIYLRQDVCARKPDSSTQHVFLPCVVINSFPRTAGDALTAV